MTHDQKGIRPILMALWPELSGRALREQAAAALGVHANTIYEWERMGMGTARLEQYVKLCVLCSDHSCTSPTAGSLLYPSTN